MIENFSKYQVMNITSPDELFNLSVTFMGEDGEGIGVRREWINQLNEYILDFRFLYNSFTAKFLFDAQIYWLIRFHVFLTAS